MFTKRAFVRDVTIHASFSTPAAWRMQRLVDQI